MSTPFQVTRVLRAKSHYCPGATGYGAAEIRPGDADLPSEVAAIQASESAFNEFPTRSPISMRISVVVDAGSPEEADREAEPYFDEVLDVVDGIGLQLAMHGLSMVGFVRNLSDGMLSPRVPDWDARPNGFGMVAAMKQGYFIPPSLEQTLLISEPNDLGSRFKRSLHWRRKARLEANLQLRVLFRWFALESVWTLSRDDDVTPRVRWCLGFPNGPGARDVDASLTAALSALDGYRHSHDLLKTHLGEVRGFRNDTVHNGFRQIDVEEPKLVYFDRLTYFACLDTHHLVETGLRSGVTTAQDLHNRLPKLFNARYTVERVQERIRTLQSKDTFYML